jgi:hypothetical protein
MWIVRAATLTWRYLGPFAALLVLLWFLSGIVMRLGGVMPELDAASRLARLRAIDLSRVAVTPSEALARASLASPPGEARLVAVLDRPVYKFGDAAVFGDTGERLAELDQSGTLAIAAAFLDLPPEHLRLIEVLTSVDRWTIPYAHALPLHRFDAEDGAGTEVYVSTRLAEVVAVTTRQDRTLAWFGEIPHRFCFVPLAANTVWWAWLVRSSAALACAVVAAGLILSIDRFRARRGARTSLDLVRLVGLVLALTWLASGLLAMEPVARARGQSLTVSPEVLSGGAINATALVVVDVAGLEPLAGGRPIKEIVFLRVQGSTFLSVDFDPQETYRLDRLLVAAETLTPRRVPFTVESIRTRLAVAVPARIADVVELDAYDAYYRARDGRRPLPVLRFEFDDPAGTWLHVDPTFSRIVDAVDASERRARWFSGVHSLDLMALESLFVRRPR